MLESMRHTVIRAVTLVQPSGAILARGAIWPNGRCECRRFFSSAQIEELYNEIATESGGKGLAAIADKFGCCMVGRRCLKVFIGSTRPLLRG